jgi:uroporphyrinogen decarboxylase
MFDRLTPRERFGLLVIDEPQDRIPVYPIVTSHAAAVAGIRLRDYYTDGARLARAQIMAQECYGHDFISVFSEVGLIAEALGSGFDYPEHDLPVLRRPLLTSVEQSAELPALDFRTAGRCPVYYDAIDYAYQAVGDRIPILAFVPAPFTTALHLIAAEELLVHLRISPDPVHELLKRITEATIGFLVEVISHSALPVLVDPLASGSVISPRAYQEFALPYERRLIDFLHRYDLDIVLHICGDTTPMLDLLPQSHADLISLDRVDLTQARSLLGDRLRLIGNFDTTRLLLGTPDAIESEVRAMVAQARGNRKGYVAATGCEVPLHTPAANVKAFIRGAKIGDTTSFRSENR